MLVAETLILGVICGRHQALWIERCVFFGVDIHYNVLSDCLLDLDFLE